MDHEEADKSAYERLVQGGLTDRSIEWEVPYAELNPYAVRIITGDMLVGWDVGVERLQKAVLDSVGIVIAIDEVAVMFPNEKAMWHWIIKRVQDPKVKVFNAAQDHVHCQPMPSDYSVQYVFMEVEERQYRIEAMHILNGVSPLHSALLERNRDVPHPHAVEVHYSFKCHNIQDYNEFMSGLEAHEWRGVQFCESTYGRFSYWRPNDPEVWPYEVYLKPRVNTRDGAPLPKSVLKATESPCTCSWPISYPEASKNSRGQHHYDGCPLWAPGGRGA